MQALAWFIRILIVLVLVWFALKNGQVVTLHGLPGQSWQAQLAVVVLAAFVIGVLIGLVAWIPTFVRQRREMAQLRKRAKSAAAAVPAPALAPPASPPAVAPPAQDSHGV